MTGGGKEPRFNEKCNFPKEPHDNTMLVECWNANLSNDDALIGRAAVDIGPVVQQRFASLDIKLVGARGSFAGVLSMTIAFRPLEPEQAPH